MRVDFLITQLTPPRGAKVLMAAYEGAHGCRIDARIIRSGSARPDAWLVLYGLGGPDRFRYVDRPNLMAFDIGYWERELPARKYRVSLNGLHPRGLVMRGARPSPQRWALSGLPILSIPVPKDGPVMLVGNGPKSTAIGAAGWAAAKSRELKAAGLRVVYRPKPGRALERDVVCDGVVTGPIEDELRKVSLVVCRHSNVAVDACRLGVPVACEDGAAAAIYPRELANRDAQPSLEQREEFLHRLAWWQWTAEECRSGGFWHWAQGVMREVR